jgi:hypothetical protein
MVWASGGSRLRASEGGGRGLLIRIDQLAHLFSSFCKASSSCTSKDGVADNVFHLFFLCEDFKKAVKHAYETL